MKSLVRKGENLGFLLVRMRLDPKIFGICGGVNITKLSPAALYGYVVDY